MFRASWISGTQYIPDHLASGSGTPDPKSHRNRLKNRNQAIPGSYTDKNKGCPQLDYWILMVEPIQRMRIDCNRYHVAAMPFAESPLSANDTESQFVGQSVTHFFAEHPSSLVATVTDSTFTSTELFFSTGVTATVERSTVITGGGSRGHRDARGLRKAMAPRAF
jgi:hypothetical protein